MKTKSIPPIIMLSAGAVTCITMYMRHYELKKLLMVLLVVLIGFYIAGIVVKRTIENFQRANEEMMSEEGEVIEKEAAEEAEEAEVEETIAGNVSDEE